MKINTYKHNSDKYPKRLLDLFDPPNKLHIMGKLELEKPLIAVIGSRRSSTYGRQTVESLLPEIVKSGIGVISGLAFGIDGLAHRSTLNSGGYTVAVVATGLPEIYPKTHRQLSQNILSKGGAIVSENQAPHDVYKSDFVARNRIIAGLADAVLVIEATQRSGTLTTVGFALDMGRSVMAVPSSIFSRSAKGTHTLIKQGAQLVEGIDDILDCLGIPRAQKHSDNIALSNDPNELQILKYLGEESAERQDILLATGLDPIKLNTALTHLELRGVVVALGGDRYGLR